MTQKEKQQFNKMRRALKEIASYQSPDKLRRESQKDWGLDYEEALEMAYENVISTAKYASKGIRELK